MKPYQQLFAELKRRSVFKVTAVYGAVGFGLLQVADPLASGLRLPDTFVPFVVALLLLGFPVALGLAWAFEVTPEGMRRTVEVSPAEIERIVAEPAAKRWPAGLLALAGIAALGGGVWWAGVRMGRSDAAVLATEQAVPQLTFVDPAADPRPSIAVLPFVNMSAEQDQEYFSDGITEELLNTLARIRELKVAARTSAFAFKGGAHDMRAVGDSLGVAYLVEGSVRKAGDQLRITAQLIDAADGSHLWSEQYDRELVDVFAIQTEIAEAIAAELRVPLGLDAGKGLVAPTDDLEAYDLYLAGRARMRERGANLDEAVKLFEAAIARDSNWAPAWAGLAESRSLLPFYTAADSAFWDASLTGAERAATRALELDPSNASAAVALGSVHRDRWEWEAAEAAYARALRLDPDNVEAHQQYAEYLGYVGRFDEAYDAALRALALDRSPIRLNAAGFIGWNNLDYRRAAEFLDEGIALDSAMNVPHLRINRAHVHLATDRSPRGRELYVEALARFLPELAESLSRAWPATAVLPTAEAAVLVTRGSPRMGAQLWMILEQPDQALEALESYIGSRVPFGGMDLLWAPFFDPLRTDPRYQAVLAASGLEGRRLVRSELATE